MKHRITHQGKLIAMVAGVVMAGGLAGCTPQAPGTQAPGTTSEAAPSAGVTHPGTVTPGPENDLELRSHVVLESCKASEGSGWVASGTVKNAGQESHEYAITIHFTDAQATDIGKQQIKVEVAAGATESWSVTQKVKGQDDARCVLGPIT